MRIKETIQKILSRDAHPFVQFIKYGICGGLATAVDLVITFLLAWLVFSAFKADEPIVRLLGLQVEEISETIRARNYFIARSISFMFSNMVAYITNFVWVFKPGRHSRKKEISLFYVISLISFGIGTGLGWALIKFLNWGAVSAVLANVFASVMINFAGRKFIVFKG